MENKNIFSVFIFVMILLLSVVLITVLTSGNQSLEVRAIDRAQNKDIVNFLILGTDNAASLADVIILTSINTISGEMCMTQIPRDTYFSHGGSSKKINCAARDLGAREFSNALARALGIEIDHYLSIDTQVLSHAIDMLSGVEIEICEDMDYQDLSQGLSISLKKGRHLLNGAEALGYIRYRAGYETGDLGRLDAQKQFLFAFAKRMGEQKDPFNALKTIRYILSNSQNNISDKAMLSIGLKLSKAKSISLVFMTAAGKAVRADSGAWYYILSRESVKEQLVRCHGADFSVNDFDIGNIFVDKQTKLLYDIYDNTCEYRIYTAEDFEKTDIN